MADETLIGPDGHEYELKPGVAYDEAKAKKLGFRLATPEAPRTGAEKLKAAFNSAGDAGLVAIPKFLSGATAGVSDVVLSRSQSASDRAEMLKEQEEHPAISTAGEVTGMVLSPLNKIAAPLKGAVGVGTVARRVGGEVISQGLIGGLQSVGSEVGDAALKDHELTAEQLLAAGAKGAGLGAVGGAVGAGVGEAANKLLPKAADKLAGVSDKLEELAQDKWFKAAKANKKAIESLSDAEKAGTADVFRQHIGLQGDLKGSAESIAAERDALTKQVAQQAGVDDLGTLTHDMSKDDAREALKELQAKHGEAKRAALADLDQTGARPSISDLHANLNDFESRLNPAERDIVAPDLKRTRAHLDEMGTKPVGQGNGFSDLDDIRSTYDKSINYKAEATGKTSLQRQLVHVIRDGIDTQAEAAGVATGSDSAERFLQAKKTLHTLYGAEDALKGKATGSDAIAALAGDLTTPEAARLGHLTKASDILKNAIDSGAIKDTFSMKDYLFAGAAHAATGDALGILKTVGGMVGHKFLSERGPAAIATLADALADSPAMRAMASSFAAKISTAAPLMGGYGARIMGALSTSPQHALAAHLVQEQVDPGYAEAARNAGLNPSPNATATTAGLEKANSIAQLAAVAEAHGKDVDRHIDRIIRGERGEVPVSGDHSKHIELAKRLAADPNAMLEYSANSLGAIGGISPSLAAQIAAKQQGLMQFTNQATQQPAKAGMLAPDWQQSQAEKARIDRQISAARDPLTVLKHAAAGTLVADEMAAYKAVWPKHAEDTAQRALLKLANTKQELSYRQKRVLGLLTGSNLDGTMGQAIAANQRAIAGANAAAKPSPAPAGNKATPARADKLTVADRWAPDSGRRNEGRG